MKSVLKNLYLVNFFKSNPETITQSINVSFNEPQDPSTTLSARVDILG